METWHWNASGLGRRREGHISHVRRLPKNGQVPPLPPEKTVRKRATIGHGAGESALRQFQTYWARSMLSVSRRRLSAGPRRQIGFGSAGSALRESHRARTAFSIRSRGWLHHGCSPSTNGGPKADLPLTAVIGPSCGSTGGQKTRCHWTKALWPGKARRWRASHFGNPLGQRSRPPGRHQKGP